MVINIICKSCKSNSSLSLQKCKRCGASLSSRCRYKVIVTNARGKRVTKTAATLKKAKQYEAKFIMEVEHERFFGVVSTRLHLNSAAKLSEQPEPPLFFSLEPAR